jgi:DNA-directed RNA polymerase specialized sigma24 family protein/ribosome-associated translation inhibitor RaiA
MNVHFSYKISKTSALEKQVKQQLQKLNKYLQVFRPELVHVKGLIEESRAREGFVVSLNLRLPSGQMAAQEKSAVAATALKAAFDALIEQLKHHKQVLRSKHKWVRRRDSDRRDAEIASFETTLAVVRPETVSPGDIAGYIDVSLPRLERFIERQIAYRVSLGELAPAQIDPDEVVAEAIANALSDEFEKPERMKIEPWLHRLAREAIDCVAAGDCSSATVSLEGRHGVQNVQASDEARLQFHQPDDRLLEDGAIADGRADNPELMAVRQELIKLVQLALHDAGRSVREVFILHAVEGFSPEEIAVITNHTLEEVRAYIRKARQHLQRALPLQDAFKNRLADFTQSA